MKNKYEDNFQLSETRVMDPAGTKHVQDALKVIIENTTAVPFRRHGNNHKCFFCETTFLHAADLINHSQNHPSSEVDAVNAFDESVIKIDVTNLACKICSEVLGFEDLIPHLRNKHNLDINEQVSKTIVWFKLTDGNFKCLICEKVFKIFGALLLHIHREHLKCNMFCEACGESFTANQDLVKHTLHSHSFGSCKCNFCDRTFINRHRRDSHMKLEHSSNYICPHCNSTFKKKNQLDRHVVQFHNTPNHKCDKCSIMFKTNRTLANHYKKVHLKQKNVTCEVCGMMFFDTGVLNLHKVRHAGEKPFECDTCRKKFARKAALKLHVRIHTDERRYVCNECGKAFVQWSGLHGHLHIHSDERNFKCLICEKSFKMKKALRKHSLNVHQKGKAHAVYRDI